MLWQLFLILLLGYLLVLRWKGRRLRKVCNEYKRDWTGVPGLGNALDFIGGGENRMLALQNLGRTAIKYDGWSCMQLGAEFYAIVADPLEADYVMKNHLEKHNCTKMSHQFIGNGLIFAPVSIWKPRRKVMAPTFSQHNLNQFVNVFAQKSVIMADNLSMFADRRTLPLWKYMTAYSMDSVCQTTLGIDVGVQKKKDHIFFTCFQQYADISAKRIFSPWMRSEIIFKWLYYFGRYSLVAKCVKVLQGFINDIIEKKKEKLQIMDDAKISSIENENKEKRSFKPILELLIEESGGDNGYTHEELREESSVILVAGTDTSAVGAAFVTVMLAKYPHIQEKVYKEIYELYGDSDRLVKAEDLRNLTYLEAVIKETMRLYPPVPITARQIVKEDVTPMGKRLVPGMGVAISHWAIHRNPKYWGEDADVFRPERFFDSPPTHPSAYVPFSSGPRSCLGYKYAMMSMMTVTTTLLRRYVILPAVDDMRLSFEIMLKDVNEFQVRLESRKRYRRSSSSTA